MKKGRCEGERKRRREEEKEGGKEGGEQVEKIREGSLEYHIPHTRNYLHTDKHGRWLAGPDKTIKKP